MATLKIIIILCFLFIESTQSDMISKVFKGCDMEMINMKIGSVMQCVKSELSELEKLMKPLSSSKDDSSDSSHSLIATLRVSVIQENIIPPIANFSCSKRAALLHCVEPMTDLTCVQDIIHIAINVGMQYFVRPVFYYVCEEIVMVKEAVADLIRCGLAVHKNVMNKCVPNISPKSVKLENICSFIEGPYGCLMNEINEKCTILITKKISGLFNLIAKNIGCQVSSESKNITTSKKVGFSNTEDLNSVEEDVYVNINRHHKSSAALVLYSATTLILPCLLTLKLYFL